MRARLIILDVSDILGNDSYSKIPTNLDGARLYQQKKGARNFPLLDAFEYNQSCIMIHSKKTHTGRDREENPDTRSGSGIMVFTTAFHELMED